MVFNQEAFIEQCRAALRETSVQQAMREVVAAAVRDTAGVEAALGAPASAGIQTVLRSDDLTILNVVWAPEMMIYPHNHETWAVIGIYGGQEDNVFYRRRSDGQGLQQVNGRSLSDHDTVVLGHDVIHSVTNPRRAYTGALHVYGGDFFAIPRCEWASADAEEQPYSIEHALHAFAEANERAKALIQQAG